MGVEKTYQTTTPTCKFNKSHSIDIYRPPALRRSIEEHENSSEIRTNSKVNDTDASEPQSINNSRRRERRPDRAVYVPRARRSQTTPPQLNNGSTNPPTECTSSPTSSSNFPPSSSSTVSSVDKSNQHGLINKPKERTNPVTGVTNGKTPSNSTVTGTVTVPMNITKTPIDITKNSYRTKSSNHQQTNGFLINSESTLPKTCDKTSNSTNISMSNMSQTVESTIKKESDIQLRLIEDATHVNTPAKCDKDIEELRRASKEINRSNRRIIKQTFPSDILEIPDIAVNNNNKINKIPSINSNCEVNETKNNVIDQDDDWDTMYDDNGECLDQKVIDELTASVGKVRIEAPKKNYEAYHIKQTLLNDEEFPHVLEVSNFPMEFKTPDLLMVFSHYKESGFVIKWVNDTHALAVFSSSTIAAEVLANGHPFVTLKPLAEACLESRLKAKKCSGAMQPYRPRPETCVALARRLVSGALGVRLKTTAIQRENEKRVLREAKERKLLAAKQRDEVWEN